MKATTIWPVEGEVAELRVGAVGGAVTVVAADGALHTSPGVIPLFETGRKGGLGVD